MRVRVCLHMHAVLKCVALCVRASACLHAHVCAWSSDVCASAAKTGQQVRKGHNLLSFRGEFVHPFWPCTTGRRLGSFLRCAVGRGLSLRPKFEVNDCCFFPRYMLNDMFCEVGPVDSTMLFTEIL